MNKFYTLAIGLLATVAAQAQVFPEGFETLDLETGGWTATQAAGASASQKWVIIPYAKETAQFPKNIPTMEICGEKVLKCTASGTFSGTGTAPDNRLVSPEITVGDDCYLSFLMANNFAGNAAANVTEQSKVRFTVSVSPTGDSAPESFTDLVYEAIPVGLNTWKPVSIDLSAYKGQTVRVMLRCYMPELFKSAVMNTLYIDNIDLAASKSTDLKLANLGGLYHGTVHEQQAGVEVINNGASTIESFTLNVKLNDRTVKSETIEHSLAPDETYTYNFDITLSAGENTLAVEGVVPGDYIADNNSLSATTIVDTAVEPPFTLASDDTQESQLISTRKGTTRRPAGWMYFANYKQWIHTTTTTGAKAYLYTAAPLKLEKGAIKVDVKGSLGNSTGAGFEVFLTRRTDQFGDKLGSVIVTGDSNEKMMLINVPETGDYYVAFGVTDAAASSQFKLDALNVIQASDLPDVEVAGVTSSLFAPVGAATALTVQVRNTGVGAATDVNVSYTVGETTVTESIPSIEGGAAVAHTFGTPLTLDEGKHEITVAVKAGGDQNVDNDVMKVEFNSYPAKTLPYKDSFEDEADNTLWTVANLNEDNASWFMAEGYEFDGTHIASLPAASVTDHNDWIISPAITVGEAYDGRLSFYYGAGGNTGAARIKVYLTTSKDPAAIGECTAMLDLDCDGVNVSYASAPVRGLEAGTYYVAFHAAGGRQPLLIDDVRLDDNAEVAVTGISVSNPEPAYDHEPSTVSIVLHNYGKQPVSGAKAAYAVYTYHVNSAESEMPETVEETIDAAIPAGGDFTFSFAKQITYPQEASYMVKAVVACPEGTDADDKNNSYQGYASQRLVTMHAPAMWDMEISDNLAGYTFDKNKAWNIAGVNPYDGIRSLFHKQNILDAEGDQVVLNRIHLMPGTYQFSFFWQTTRGMEGDEYKQSFDVLMGDSPETMDKVLMSFDNVTAANKKHAKAMADVTIQTEGNYYFGFNLRKGAAQGQIVIDNVKLEVPEARYDMTARTARYEADFTERGGEWQHYHPNAMAAQQWTVETDPQLGLSYMQAIEFTSFDTHYSASYLQAPAMQLRGGCTYTVSLYPEFLGLEQSGKPLKGTEAIVIYRSGRDLPSDFVELGRATATADGTYTVTFTPEKTGLCYLSLLPYCEEDAAFRLHSFKVEMTSAPEDGNWEDAGTCSFTDPVFSALGFEPQTLTDVVMQRNADVENQYRLVNPYAGWTVPEDKKGEYTFSATETTPIIFDIIDNKYVYVHPFRTGWTVSTAEMKGEISCHMQADNLLANNLTMEQVIALAPGCLATLDYDRITATATFAYYGYEEPPVFLTNVSGMEGNYAANTHGEFLITLPEEMIPDPFEGWTTVGTAVMTEVFVSGCYDELPHAEIECQLQEKDDKAGVYRLVNPYSTWENPDADAFTYDSSRPRFLVIHAENASYVWFEPFVTGVSAKEGGMITGQCYASDFIGSLSLEQAISTVPDFFGSYEENVFSFAEASAEYKGRDLPTVFTRFAATPNNITRCNAANDFKVVFKLDSDGAQLPEADFDGEAEYYNLQGLRLKEPTPGQPVIVRQGNHAFKAILR